eukprot:gene10501-10661_t
MQLAQQRQIQAARVCVPKPRVTGRRAVIVRAEAAATATVVPPAAPTTKEHEELQQYGVFKLSYNTANEDPSLTKNWQKTVRVAVTGASGQISNHLLFMGVAMELEDSLYPLLREVSIGTDPYAVFQDAEWALMIGAKPRGPGQERADLLDQNGRIFVDQGKALNEVASRNCKVLVVGNPCNTNALIAMENAPNIPRKNFHALTRLDENRAKCQLALKAGKFYTNVSRTAIWGNHSTTQVPDFINARIGGRPAIDVIQDMKWFKEEFTPTVAQRGGALIKKWGRSSAASTAVSIADAIRSLVTPTAPGDCFSSAVCTDGNPYGIAEGIIYSMPCRSKGDGDYEICDDFIIDDWLRTKIQASEEELVKEKECVGHLIGITGAACRIGPGEDTMLPGEN